MKINHNFKFACDDSIQMSVFNCDGTDIDRANDAFKTVYGRTVWGKKIRPILNQGLMTIFRKTPSDELLTYVLLICQAQNARKDRK